MSLIRVYEKGSIERGILEYFASVFNAEMEVYGDINYHMSVEDIYFDISQDWKYTGLLTNDWQALTPRDYENIITSDSFSEVWTLAIDYARAILDGKKCVHLTY